MKNSILTGSLISAFLALGAITPAQAENQNRGNSSFTEKFGSGQHNRFQVRNLKLWITGDNYFTYERARNYIDHPYSSEPLQAELEYKHDCPECGGAINQIVVGLVATTEGEYSDAHACIYSGGKSSDGWQKATFELKTPDRPLDAIFDIRVRYAQAYDCKGALKWWKVDRPDGPTKDSTIGFLDTGP